MLSMNIYFHTIYIKGANNYAYNIRYSAHIHSYEFNLLSNLNGGKI